MTARTCVGPGYGGDLCGRPLRSALHCRPHHNQLKKLRRMHAGVDDAELLRLLRPIEGRQSRTGSAWGTVEQSSCEMPGCAHGPDGGPGPGYARTGGVLLCRSCSAVGRRRVRAGVAVTAVPVPPTRCLAPGCERASYGQLPTCELHHNRLVRTGRLEPPPRASELEVLLGQLSVVDALSGCWLSRGRANNNGYVNVRLGDQHELVHRLAYKLLVGPIPPRMVVDHVCRRRVCFNPAHLDTVSYAENMRRSRLTAEEHWALRPDRELVAVP